MKKIKLLLALLFSVYISAFSQNLSLGTGISYATAGVGINVGLDLGNFNISGGAGSEFYEYYMEVVGFSGTLKYRIRKESNSAYFSAGYGVTNRYGKETSSYTGIITNEDTEVFYGPFFGIGYSFFLEKRKKVISI